VKRFICLTDRVYYVTGPHNGYAAAVSIRHGIRHPAGAEIRPAWVGRWKDRSRDRTIRLSIGDRPGMDGL